MENDFVFSLQNKGVSYTLHSMPINTQTGWQRIPESEEAVEITGFGYFFISLGKFISFQHFLVITYLFRK